MIARAPEYEPRLYDALRESFGSDAREGVHLSGLLTPRMEFWKRADPKPLTNAELGYFVGGRGHEDALARFVGKHFKPTESVIVEGISMRPDFESITNVVIPAGEYAEFKTRRSNLPENDEQAQTEFSTYRGQLRGYMTLRGRARMFLIVLSLTEGKTGDPLSRSEPVFAIYAETMTREEREEHMRTLLARRDLYLRACASFEQGGLSAAYADVLVMPLCADWQCGKPTKTILETAVCQTCGQVFKSEEFGPRKHLESAKGAGHDIQPAVVQWDYLPRCKWYAQCQPWLIDPARGPRTEGDPARGPRMEGA